MDAAEATSHDFNNLYNLTMSLATSVSFHQLILHIRLVFANLCDSLNYIEMVSAHTMDYIDAATSGTLFPHILPVMDHYIYQIPYHLCCTYLFHQMIPYIFTDIYAFMF